VPNNPNFTNNTAAANYGVGAPVKVQYPDNLMIADEEFKFELWIYVKVGNGFDFKLFHTWPIFKDNNMIPAGEDKVVDFVLGSCNLSNTDLQLAPYMNLPGVCDLTVGGASPGTKGTYFDVTLSGIGTGYDIANGLYGVYCGDQGAHITLGATYPGMGVYSSLIPVNFPSNMEQNAKDHMDNANWLMNHLDNYTGETWQDIQNALWTILDNDIVDEFGVPTALSNQMAADALANGDNYVPLPGGWAAVIFYDNVGMFQLIYTIVDP
jgi:hypothetical protein